MACHNSLLVSELFRAASLGCLPEDFDQWAISDNNGSTVAHIAALHGHLPKGFSQWSLADNKGWTVAHDAALKESLPPDFKQWDLADKKGLTVREIANKKALERREKGLKSSEFEHLPW